MAANVGNTIDFADLYRRLDEADARIQAGLSSEERDRLLAARAAALAGAREGARKAGQEVLVFTVVGEHYAVPIDRVEQVVTLNQLTVLPGAARHVLGAMASRSRIVVVLDLRLLLGLQGGGLSDLTQVVVVSTRGGSFGIAAETVEGRRELSADLEQALPVDGPFILVGSDRLGLLNLDELDSLSAGATEVSSAEGS